MAGKWAYSEMTKEAKKYGGPEEYVEAIQEEAFQEGRESRDSDVKAAGVKGGAITALGLGIVVLALERRRRKKEERIKMEQKAKEAKKELLEELGKETEIDADENQDDKA